jgi:hypothetical protein
MVKILFIAVVMAFLSACTAPTKSLRPIAEQNQENLVTLSTNVRTVLALYEPLLQATTESILYQHIGKIEQEMIAVIGPAIIPVSEEATWEALFDKAAMSPLAHRDKYLERYRLAKSAYERGLEANDLERLKRQEGWIYSAATRPDFTPVTAHNLLKQLQELRQQAGQDSALFFKQAYHLLALYDPKIAVYQEINDSAHQLLNGLKQELQDQLNTAHLHAQSIGHFANSEADIQQVIKATAGGMDSTQLMQVLDALSQKYLNQPTMRDAAVEFLTDNLKKYLKKP